jgi:hypothetical protein
VTENFGRPGSVFDSRVSLAAGAILETFELYSSGAIRRDLNFVKSNEMGLPPH